MTLSQPSYIPVDLIRRPPITYEWDFWDPYPVLGDVDSDVLRLLANVSDRAMIAYAIACSEWVTFRLVDHLGNDRRAFDYLEACWAFEMSDRIDLPKETKEREWQGIVLAPIDLSLVTIINTVYFTEDKQGELKAAFAELISLHVLSDTRPFIRWRAKILRRLEALYQRRQDEAWGRPVPREALDPAFPEARLLDPDLVTGFLAEVRENPFVEYVR